jgi:hypothetical protein
MMGSLKKTKAPLLGRGAINKKIRRS